MANYFSNPNNGIKVGSDVDCSCGDQAVQCQASFSYVYDSVLNTVTVTGASFLADGDAVVLATGSNANVTDESGTAATPVAGDETAALVVDVSGLDAGVPFRIDYDITTDNGCTSAIALFFDPSVLAEAEGSTDPYSEIR